MIYLDYSATTPVDKDVLESFLKATKYFANSNSLHSLGRKSKKVIDVATKEIADILKVQEEEIIYTSGASESNNLAIKGLSYLKRGKKIITSHYEHESIYQSLEYMKSLGYEILNIKEKDDGTLDLDNLNDLMDDDVLLVTICYVASETGLINQIEEIKKIVKKYPKALLHVDMTQALGKIPFSLENIDLASFSAHKIFGLKGIGILYKKKNLELLPLISGGKSITKYRSGTPPLELIVSLCVAIKKIKAKEEQNYNYVLQLANYLRKNLENIDGVMINSIHNSPYILNISYLKEKPETIVHYLESKDIYISTKTACSRGDYSKSVYALTKDQKRAEHSLRISLAYMTKKEELDILINALKSYRI